MHTAFATARVRPLRATLLPLVHAPGRALFSPRHQEPLASPVGRQQAAGWPGSAGQDWQRTTTGRARQDGREPLP